MSEDPIREGLKLFAGFMGTGAGIGHLGAQEMRAWVHSHPDLLDPGLDQPLDDWLQAVRDAEDSREAAALGVYVQMRTECRDYGIDAAFDSQAWEDEQTEIAGTLLRMRSEAARAETTYARTRSVQDLENIVRLWSQCAERAGTVGAPWLIRADFAISLSVAYLKRYRVTRDQVDSDHAVSTLRAIADELPLTSGLRLTCLINLAVGWRDRSSYERSLPFLDRAIEVYEQVANDYAGTGRTDDQVVTAFGDRCRCLWVRYQMTGDITDLRKAGRAQKAWLTFKPEIRPRDAAWQAELVAALAEHGMEP